MIRVGLLAAVAVWTLLGAAAAQELNFDPAITANCLARTEMPEDRRACIWKSAEACMTATPGGSSTAAIGGCLELAYAWWDTRLNAVYKDVMRRARAFDAETKPNHPRAPALQGMQQAWLSYRDGRCSWETSLWAEVAGAGAAYAGCQMVTTAEQVFVLENGQF